MAVTLITTVTAGPGSNGGATAGITTTGATLIVIGASWYGGGGPAITFSDNKSNAWMLTTPQSSGTATDMRQQFAYCVNPTVGTGHTFSVTGTGTYPAIVVHVFAGTAGYTYQSRSAASSASVGPSVASGSVTPHANGALLLTGFAINNGALPAGTTVSTAGFAVTSQAGVGGVCYPGAAAYAVQATAAAINPTWAWSSGTFEVAVSTAVFALPAGTGLARLQSTVRSQNSSATTLALTFPVPPAVGHGVVVAVTATLSAAPACADNRGNPYSLAVSRANGATLAALFVCPSVTSTAAPFTITLTAGGLANWNGSAVEVTGVGPGLTLDQTAGATGSSTTPATGATAALTGGDSFQAAVFAVGASPSSIAVDAVSPVWGEEWEGPVVRGEADTRVVPSAAGTTPAASWTTTAAGSWAAVIAAFTGPAAAAVERVQPFLTMPV